MAKRASSSSSSSSTAASAVKKAKVNTKAVVAKKPTTSGKKNVKVESKASTNGNKVKTSKAKKAKTVKNKETEPPLEEVYDFEIDEYTVERIIDKRIEMDGFVQYFVKWLGYSEVQGTWKYVHELTNSMKHVLEWEREQGTNWRLPDYSDPDKSEQENRDYTLMRHSQILDNHDDLTIKDEYFIKEKYGRANGHTWYLVESKTNGVEPRVLCLSDVDPYHFRLSREEQLIVLGLGAWD